MALKIIVKKVTILQENLFTFTTRCFEKKIFGIFLHKIYKQLTYEKIIISINKIDFVIT
jgi:hypothetical protein